MTSPWIDLRSDTVTKPDAAMRRAMATAEVGDDVYDEDPTVRRLEQQVAELLGQQAALFVPSGTMGNQIALHLHGRSAGHGAEVLGPAAGHVFTYEMGAMAALSGLMPRPVPTADGRLDPGALATAILPPLPYRARCGVLVIENTHNLAGGTVSARPRLDGLLAVARRHQLVVHLDGARLWNAAVRLEVAPAELAAGFDSVMVCLSKGLGAPVGSLLAGSRELCQEAWRVRKMLGGGMRQVGVLAAAGLVALADDPATDSTSGGWRQRLASDHQRAHQLAVALAELPGFLIDPQTVETNIVIARLVGELAGPSLLSSDPAAAMGEPTPAARLLAALRDHQVLAGALDAVTVRFVTHRDVDDQGLAAAVTALRTIAANRRAG